MRDQNRDHRSKSEHQNQDHCPETTLLTAKLRSKVKRITHCAKLSSFKCNCSTLHLRSRGHRFDSRLRRYPVVTLIWMGDCLRTGKPYLSTNTKINSAFYPSSVGNSSTGLSGLGCGEARHLCRVAGNTV